MKEKSILNKVRTLLGMEVKLEMMKLTDGVTIFEAEMFEPNAEVFVVTEDEQRIPVPVGEYELESGIIVVVSEEGIIGELKESDMEEEPEAEVEVEAEKEVSPIAKKVIESTVKESHFSAEEVDALKKEIEELKTKLSAQTVEVAEEEKAPVELSEEVKPISYNPENEVKVIQTKLGKKGSNSPVNRILSKLNNI